MNDYMKVIINALKQWVNKRLTVLDEKVGNKVESVEGKMLSTNDYTNEEKEKLAGIEAGATRTTVNGQTGDIQISGTSINLANCTEEIVIDNMAFGQSFKMIDKLNVTEDDSAIGSNLYHISTNTVTMSLPIPKSLTFTGAVEGAYDGTEAVSINIPEGFSGSWNDLTDRPFYIIRNITSNTASTIEDYKFEGTEVGIEPKSFPSLPFIVEFDGETYNVESYTSDETFDESYKYNVTLPTVTLVYYYDSGDQWIEVTANTDGNHTLSIYAGTVDVKTLDEAYIPDSVKRTTFLESDGIGYQQNPVDAADEIWTQWDSRLSFGMNTDTAPVPFEVGGQLLVDGTIIAKNNGTKDKNRHGYHVYEAYGKDNYSRLTMLMDKHDTEANNKPSAEIYYYTGANHYASSYGNTKIGSDVKNHSFSFDRDRMTAYGEIDSKMPITLARISLENDLDSTYATTTAADTAYEPEVRSDENTKCLKYISLKNADNGAMFYDTDRNIPVMKVDGKWCEVPFAVIGDESYDIIRETESIVADIVWEVGVIGPTGDNRVSESRLRTSSFIPNEIVTIKAADGYLFTILFLDENGAHESGAYYRPSTGSLDTSAAYIDSIDLTGISFDGYPNKKLILKRVDEATITIDEASNLTYGIADVVDDNNNSGTINDRYISNNIARITDIPDAVITPATASVGQTIIVKSVDENGKPTEWEAVDPWVITSSSEGSSKQFKITIDDEGVLTVSEIVKDSE